MILPIIQSMKDSPDEINRKRYVVFVDLIAELVACQNELAALKQELARDHVTTPQASNSKPFPSDHYGL